MKLSSQTCAIILCLLICLATTFPPPAQASGTVKALVFHKPDCPDCNILQRKVLPEIKSRFKNQLTILSLSTADAEGGKLYLNALLTLGIPLSKKLPIVIIGKQYWSGTEEVGNALPEAVRASLSNHHTDWPDIPGLKLILSQISHLSASDQEDWYISENPAVVKHLIANMKRKFGQDITGNSYAVLVLISMVISLFYAIGCFIRHREREPRKMGLFPRCLILVNTVIGITISWQLAEADAILQGTKPVVHFCQQPLTLLILLGMLFGFITAYITLFGHSSRRFVNWQRWSPLLFLAIGFVAAAYLAYIEAARTAAVCGAVGDCNAVQQSQYANLFGIISIAGLGILCQLMVLGGWILIHHAPKRFRDLCRVMVWMILASAVAFFIYLTFLEPFVIGATCFWCLTAATAMTLQLLIITNTATAAWQRLRLSQ